MWVKHIINKVCLQLDVTLHILNILLDHHPIYDTAYKHSNEYYNNAAFLHLLIQIRKK